MNPRDFQELAAKLAGGSSPSEFRTSISRAYYAAFHVAAELLTCTGFHVPNGPAAHGEVARLLTNSSDPELRIVGVDLSDLRQVRNMADYQLRKTLVESASAARSSIEKAAIMIRILDACQEEPRRSTIIAGINAYLKKLEP